LPVLPLPALFALPKPVNVIAEPLYAALDMPLAGLLGQLAGAFAKGRA